MRWYKICQHSFKKRKKNEQQKSRYSGIPFPSLKLFFSICHYHSQSSYMQTMKRKFQNWWLTVSATFRSWFNFSQLVQLSAAVLLNSRLQVSLSKTSHMGSWGNVSTWMVSYLFSPIRWKIPRSKGSQIVCYHWVATLSRCMSRKNNNFESMKWVSYFLTFLKVLINFGLMMKDEWLNLYPRFLAT